MKQPSRNPVHAVIEAWRNPGPQPWYHKRAKNWLRRTWPTLANALDELTGWHICERCGYHMTAHMERPTDRCTVLINERIWSFPIETAYGIEIKKKDK